MHSIFALLLFSYPVILNPENTKVVFEVDSTWHLIQGQAKAISGRLWLNKDGDENTARVEAHLAVNKFDTDSSSRDERLREVMSAEAFPEVEYLGGPLGPGCKLSSLAENTPCTTTFPGTVRIKGVSKEIIMNLTIEKKSAAINFHSEGNLNWSEFGVEDPSILIAKLKKKVKLIIDVTLPLES